MLSMDCRENINPNTLSFGNGKGADKNSNSKVIMQKQMFETMNYSNVPKQGNNNFFVNTKTPEPLMEKKNHPATSYH